MSRIKLKPKESKSQGRVKDSRSSVIGGGASMLVRHARKVGRK